MPSNSKDPVISPLIAGAMAPGVCFVIQESSGGIDDRLFNVLNFSFQKSDLSAILTSFHGGCQYNEHRAYPYRYAAFAFPYRVIFQRRKRISVAKNMMFPDIRNNIRKSTSSGEKSGIPISVHQQSDTDFSKSFDACDRELSGRTSNKTIFMVIDTTLDATFVRTKIAEFRKLGYTIVVAGIGTDINVAQLYEIATSSSFVTITSDYGFSVDEINRISNQICVATIGPPSFPYTIIPSPTPSETVPNIISSTPPTVTPAYSPSVSKTAMLMISVSPATSTSTSSSSSPKPKSLIVTSTELDAFDPFNPNELTRGCASVDCAECGNILECYVNSGAYNQDQFICQHVMDRLTFCPDGQFTKCGQFCNRYQGVSCHAAKSWVSCPAKIGFWYGDRCMERMIGLSSKVQSFSSYNICMMYHAPPRVTCLNRSFNKGQCKCST